LSVWSRLGRSRTSSLLPRLPAARCPEPLGVAQRQTERLEYGGTRYSLPGHHGLPSCATPSLVEVVFTGHSSLTISEHSKTRAGITAPGDLDHNPQPRFTGKQCQASPHPIVLHLGRAHEHVRACTGTWASTLSTVLRNPTTDRAAVASATATVSRRPRQGATCQNATLGTRRLARLAKQRTKLVLTFPLLAVKCRSLPLWTKSPVATALGFSIPAHMWRRRLVASVTMLPIFRRTSMT
jgi:hypothetical protein